MRVSKLMGLAVVIVALAATMNALAYKTATVTNPTTFTVDTTSSAALAFSDVNPGAGTGFSTTVPSSGTNQRQLQIQVTDKMQPGSVYRFTNVFKITNNLTPKPTVNLSYDATAFAGVTVKLFKGDGSFLTDLGSVTLDSTTPTTNVDMEVSVLPNYTGNGFTDAALKITGNQ